MKNKTKNQITFLFIWFKITVFIFINIHRCFYFHFIIKLIVVFVLILNCAIEKLFSKATLIYAYLQFKIKRIGKFLVLCCSWWRWLYFIPLYKTRKRSLKTDKFSWSQEMVVVVVLVMIVLIIHRFNQNRTHSESGAWWTNPWRAFSFVPSSSVSFELVHCWYNCNEKLNLFFFFDSKYKSIYGLRKNHIWMKNE